MRQKSNEYAVIRDKTKMKVYFGMAVLNNFRKSDGIIVGKWTWDKIKLLIILFLKIYVP